MSAGVIWGAVGAAALILVVIVAFTVRDVQAERRREREYQRRREMIRARAEGHRP